MVDLFELQDERVVLTPICNTSKTLKALQKVFKKDKNYMKAYTALFYITCPDPKRNPYIDVPEHERQEMVIQEVGIDFSLDEPEWEEAIKFCEKLYTTPTRRFRLDVKIGMEKMGEYLRTQKIEAGRDGNIQAYKDTLKSAAVIASEFAKVEKMYYEELGAAIRGDRQVAYDQ